MSEHEPAQPDLEYTHVTTTPHEQFGVAILSPHVVEIAPAPLSAIETVQQMLLSSPSVLSHPTKASGSSRPLSLEVINARVSSKRSGENNQGSSFARQLTHKLSQTFGNPTVVHRPNLRTRPSLLSFHEDSQAANVRDETQSPTSDSTKPSSYNTSGSASAGNPSTAKTSLESNASSQRSARHHGGKASLGDGKNGPVPRENTLTPIQENSPVVCPTIATVETTANAKIFFETHFNSLLATHQTPRSLRRDHFEAKLESQNLTAEDKRYERRLWDKFETEHLRSTRALKTKVGIDKPSCKVTVAGYRVLRILGKGSFGVVRLVRERSSDTTEPESQESLPPGVKQLQQMDGIGLKGSIIENFMSGLELPRIIHRLHGTKAPKEVYAMKVIRKSNMLRNCQEGHLRAERDFLAASENSRWIIPLIAAFQDNKHLYLVMEYMVGGDFLGLLFRKNILKEKHAKWYIAEMILCVEETHKAKWIHRDIKPDNFLISASGHLKISDFGLAFDGHWQHDQKFFRNQRGSLMNILGVKVKGDRADQKEDEEAVVNTKLAGILTDRKNQKARLRRSEDPVENETVLEYRNRVGRRHMAASIVGTSQYMAPEVVRGEPYDGRCDWWSIGIILFEVSLLEIAEAFESC